IAFAKRTPVGSFAGKLSGVRADDLLAHILKAHADWAPYSLTEIDDVIIGCANQAGEDNRNVARMGVILADYPHEVPATTLNRLCGSSLDAVMDAFARIQAGFGDCFLAGGVESMSRAPYVMSKGQGAFARDQKIWDTSIGWRFENPEMEKRFPLLSMGQTAEEVRRKHNIPREEQDKWAFESHQKASAAQKLGKFNDEIHPITIKTRKSEEIVSADEGPRPDSTLEKLSTLRAVFEKDGTVTAGNSSSINDGASLVMVCSEEFLKRHNLTPLVRIIGGAVHGLHPNVMGLGPVGAVEKVLTRYQLKKNQIDVFELNEAFAAQVLGCMKELELDPSKVNPLGGSIAIGHPLGASGTRVLSTLVHQMQRQPELKTGMATMCIGVGQGIALAVENCR
ncbi:MAG TPA: thiolase family protein, partial [Bacteriovoracaceae bacterium]|nr:thiolase family protein [Bacteriovoracaceae bacterium]